MPRRHPQAAFAVLEQGGDEHALGVGVAGGVARDDAVADEPGHAGGRADPQAAAAVEGEGGDVRRRQSVGDGEEPLGAVAAGAAEAGRQRLPQRPVWLAQGRLDVLGPVVVERDRVVLDERERPVGAQGEDAVDVLVNRGDGAADARHQDQRAFGHAGDRVAAGNPDHPMLILVEGADRARQAGLAELLEDAVAPPQHGAVVGADPQPVGLVDEQGGDVVRLERRGAVAVEGPELDPVEPHQPGFGAEPQEPVGVLGQCPDAVGRQAVAGLPALEVVLGERLRLSRGGLSGGVPGGQNQGGGEHRDVAQGPAESEQARHVHG